MVDSTRGGRSEDATITIDLKAKPASIDIRPDVKGAGPAIVVKGIIEVKGDDMKLCFTKDGDRPTEFKSDDARRIVFIKLKRVKPEK